jgi:tetratricopeptide (TPR) repeat protein
LIRLIGLLVSVALIGGASLAAQDVAAQREAYLAVLERYAAGDADGAAKDALAMDVRSTRRLAREMSEAGSATKPRRPRRLKLIVLLHTEAALRTATPRQQLLVAKDAVDRLWKGWKDDDAIRPFIRDWFLVVVSHLQSIGDLALLAPHIDAGLGAFDGDPELLLARGWLSESRAERAVVDRSLVREIYELDYQGRWRQRLAIAAGDYRGALRRNAVLHEATLRLGRVGALRGDDDEARRAFEQVVSGTAPASLKYLAHLFLGELAEGAGDRAAARAAYEAALGYVPAAQAPKLSLSRLSVLGGDLTDARGWVARALAETAPERSDPWWHYRRGQAWLGQARLDEFRRRGLDP